jgi:flagellar assembly protein FliH
MSDSAVRILSISDARHMHSGFRPMHREYAGPAPTPCIQKSAEDPYACGLADGQELAETAFAEERSHLRALLNASENLQPEPSEELAQLIGEAVFRLVRQIIETAPFDAEWLHKQAQKAADSIADCDSARTAWLHPDDVAIIEQTTFPLPVMADPAAERGSIRIDCSAGWVEHGRSNYLDALRIALSVEDAA